MADLKVKFATGEKGKIEEAKTSGKLDANDFVVTSDTDELAFINKNGETKFLQLSLTNHIRVTNHPQVQNINRKLKMLGNGMRKRRSMKWM